MRRQRVFMLTALTGALLALGTPAFADITGFVGIAGGPSTRVVKGAAVGAGLVIVGWEGEYSDIGSDVAQGSPRLQTGMANILLQTPFGVGGLQFYGTGGAGIYHENLAGITQTNVGINVGGGIKMNLIGPLRLRADYRVFHLAGSPIGAVYVHRFYIGANVKF
jgi:opacity protein-like surface antigen